MPNPVKRFVYVLVGWQERSASPGRPAVWRFSLEDTRARQRLGFGDLAELTAFLEAQMGTEELGGKRTGDRELLPADSASVDDTTNRRATGPGGRDDG
jgi:hypothetical protein